MEGQTNCDICEFKYKSKGSLKQHMEKKHDILNMTIVQVLTQQVKRFIGFESDKKEKEPLIEKTEDD